MPSNTNNESINMYLPQFLSAKRHYLLVFCSKNNPTLKLYIVVPIGYKQTP